MTPNRLYTGMTAEERLRWVTDYTRLRDGAGGRIALLARGAARWTDDDRQAVKELFALLEAWPWAQGFCRQAAQYGDYAGRAYRLPAYMAKAEEELAREVRREGADGRVWAEIPPGVPARRRGRPTREEAAARRRGEVPPQADNSADTRRRLAIASLLGLEVVKAGPAPREKNNAELRAEREERERREREQSPGLFPDGETAAGETAAAGQQAAADGGAPVCPSMGEIYAGRIDRDRLHLDQLAWLCSKPLQERIALVRDQRTAFGNAAQTAKVLAGRHAPEEEVARWTREAEEQMKAYEATYEAVDEELAVLHARLRDDEPFRRRFRERWRGVSLDMEQLLHITRPYWEKLKGPELSMKVSRLTEEESPEYAARRRREAGETAEVRALLRYIRRTDKGPSDERCRTMAARIERIRELRGDAEADALLPILEKTRRENAEMHRRDAEAEKGETAE